MKSCSNDMKWYTVHFLSFKWAWLLVPLQGCAEKSFLLLCRPENAIFVSKYSEEMWLAKNDSNI